MQYGRRADCLKLWLIWNYYGSEGLEVRINRLMKIAQYAEHKVKTLAPLTLAWKPEYLNICFYHSLEKRQINHDWFHNKIKESLYKKGMAMVNTASINNKKCIRLVISNPDLTEKDIDIFFENLLKIASNLLEDSKKIWQKF